LPFLLERYSRRVKSLVFAFALAGCAAGTAGGGSSRPGVMPMLSELPGDPEKRDAILDQSAQTPGPEMRKGQTKKERRVETAAAGVAAIIGSMFSTTQNVTLGSALTFDENDVGPSTPTHPHSEAPAQPSESDHVLVPWIKLTPEPAPQEPAK
jgi:hypothetical protein